ncbi:immunoglobulin superfamily member 6-like [Aulostomus maculatus]
MSPNCSAKAVTYKWFTVKENTQLPLEKAFNPLKYILNGASLHIKSLNASDSGIYICAAHSHTQGLGTSHIGHGTTLVVKENVKIMVRNILLWVAFILLSIYSLAIVTLIVLKKNGSNISIFRQSSASDKIRKKPSFKKSTFRDVLQEMYNRRNTEGIKRHRNHHQVEAADTEFNSSPDEIYQNV